MSIISGYNIKRFYQSGTIRTDVLRGIDIAVEAGEFLAIMGKSGAGKSTLLYQLSALDRPNSGNIFIDGKDILDFSEAELVNFRLFTLGYIFQDYALIPDLNAEENVLLPLLMRGLDWETAWTRAQAALESVSLINRNTNLPSQLSGGEQQRVAIARAIAGKPKIIFADEPTANLDSASGKAVIEILRQLHHSGQTIVMVTHETEYTAYCNRIVYLEDGLIIPEKSHLVYPKPLLNSDYLNTSLNKGSI